MLGAQQQDPKDISRQKLNVRNCADWRSTSQDSRAGDVKHMMRRNFLKMASNDSKLDPSSRDLMTMAIKQDDVRLLAGTKYRYGRIGSGLRLRLLCIMGPVFLIVVVLLSRFSMDSSSRILMKIESQDLDHGRSLELSEENYANRASSTPNRMTSSEAAQDGESSIEQQRRDPETKIEKDKEVGSPLPAESTIGDGKQGKDGLSMPLVNQNHTHQGEGNVVSDVDEAHVKENLIEPVVQEVQMQRQVEETSPTDNSTKLSEVEVTSLEQEKQIELLPEDLQQERNTGEDKETGDSNQRQSRLAGEKIIQPSDALENTRNSSSSTGECDVTVGKWVYDPAGPLYRSDQCSIISEAQNCQLNGRPDHEYESYKWQPDQCSIALFEPSAFLELMRNKTLAFVGDSLARNQMQSLICILLQVAEAKNMGRKHVMDRWYFPSHDFTIILMWSSWLVKPEGDLPPTDVRKLNLTELDSYAEYLATFDVTILSSGHWWTRKLAFSMEGKAVWKPRWGPIFEMEMDHKILFETAMITTLHKVGSHPDYKGLTILTTLTPDHYVGGSWDTWGSCTGETRPYNEGPKNTFSEFMRFQQLKAFEINTPRSTGGVMPNGSKLRLLDVYPILNYRGDGHPGPYRSTDPDKRTSRDSKGRPPPQDCLHWCMPGPVDTLNELLFDLLRKEMQ